MKHFFTLLTLGITGLCFAQTSQPEIFDTFQALQMSGNGQWMIGRSNTYKVPDSNDYSKESSIVNVKTGEIYGLADLFTLNPFSRPISSSGVAIQSTYDESSNGLDVPYLIVPGQEPKKLTQLFTSGPYAGMDCFAEAITDDASAFLGNYYRYPISYPFICKINSDYTVGDPEFLPLPAKNFFGEEYFYLELNTISDDAKTVVGTIVSIAAVGEPNTLPIVYKKDDNGEWSYYCPVAEYCDFLSFENCITFYGPQVALSPDGNFMACTQEIPSGVEGFPFYKVWCINLSNGEVTQIESENKDIVATRVLNDGTIIATFFATVTASYIYTPGAEDFIDFIAYAQKVNPQYGEWMEENLMQTVVDVTPSGQEVEIEFPFTGQVFVSDDLSTFCAGFQTTEFDQWYNLKLWSYVFTDFQTSGVSTIDRDLVKNGDVFNLQGQKVGSALSTDQINQLPAGIYIINGKKVAIR